MTKNEIMRMARESGMPDPMVFIGAYERFAASVAADEREVCAQLCDDLYELRASGGFPREASAARRLRDAIRARGNQ